MSRQLLTRVEDFILRPAHALILVGERGSGKTTLLEYVTAQLLGVAVEDTENNSHVMKVAGDASISIEEIRAARKFVKLKPNRDKWRVIMIDDAEKLTIEAQNALLKLLEEPPERTLILLTTNNASRLEPTVVSRCQVLHITKPSKALLEQEGFRQGFGSEEIERAYLMSGGLVGRFFRILNDQQGVVTEGYNFAKKILQSPQYERLILLQNLTTVEISNLLANLQHIVHIMLRSSKSGSQQEKLVRVYALIQDCERFLDTATPNAKLLSTHLALGL